MYDGKFEILSKNWGILYESLRFILRDKLTSKGMKQCYIESFINATNIIVKLYHD